MVGNGNEDDIGNRTSIVVEYDDECRGTGETIL